MGLMAFMGFGYNFVTDHARKIDEESARGKLEYVTRAMANCKRETYTPEDLATCEHKLHEGMVNEKRLDDLFDNSGHKSQRTNVFVFLVSVAVLGGGCWVFAKSISSNTEGLRSMLTSPEKIVWAYGLNTSVNGISSGKVVVIVARGLGEARLLGNDQNSALGHLRRLAPQAVFGYGDEQAARAKQLLAS